MKISRIADILEIDAVRNGKNNSGFSLESAGPENREACLSWRLSVALPLVMLCGYLFGMFFMPFPEGIWSTLTLSELGVIELGTAALYFATFAMMVRLVWKVRKETPNIIIVLYTIFAFAALFVALEEINYGQYFFGFETPDAIAENSTKGEFNLHNQAGNVIARRLNLLATIGFLVWCVVLPLIGERREFKHWWTPEHWSWYLIPRYELVLVALLAQAMTWMDDLYDLCGWKMNAWARATEFKEMYWALAALMLVLIIRRRILKRQVE